MLKRSAPAGSDPLGPRPILTRLSPDRQMTALDLDNHAWRFALRLYGAPGVAAECLALQDEAGIDVSLLLVVLWLGAERGVALDETLFREAGEHIAGWVECAVRPLRAVRRAAKDSPLIADPAVQAWRAKVKGAELEAERIQIALLHRWTKPLVEERPLHQASPGPPPPGGEETRAASASSPPPPGEGDRPQGGGGGLGSAALHNLRLVLAAHESAERTPLPALIAALATMEGRP